MRGKGWGFLLNLHNIRNKDILIVRPVILSCREAQRHRHKVAGTEQASCRIAEHSCHILVLVLAAKLLKDDVALHSLATLRLLTLYSESLALLYHSHDFCVHNNLSIKPLPQPLNRKRKASPPTPPQQGGE